MEATETGQLRYVLNGLAEIGAVFHRHPRTVRRWIQHENFPAVRLPSGEWVTSYGLIDGWLLGRATELDN